MMRREEASRKSVAAVTCDETSEQQGSYVRPRLLIVGAFPPPGTKIYGGVITSCRLLLESNLPVRAELVLLDSTQISNPPPGLFVRAIRAAKRTLRYIGAFEKSRPDSVLLFCSVGASMVEKGFMAWYARLRGVSALLFPRGGALMTKNASAIVRAWMRLCFRGAAIVLCQGPAWQRFATGTLGFERERCPIIPNWTATSRLLEVGRARVDAKDGTVKLLYVGWVEFDKGVAELMEMFRDLSQNRDVRLHVAGDGHAMPFVREFVTVNQLESKTCFSGWLDAQSILSAYRDADVLVLPSWAEGFPNAMIEAMAAGLAVVVTRVGNVPDVVRDRQEALLVEPKDVAGLLMALAEIVDRKDFRNDIANAGRRLAEREFAVELAVDRILAAVEQARTVCRSDRQKNGTV